MINIIGGKFRGKKINVPNEGVRPTSAIKREAIFSILESYANKNSIDLYNNKCCIDMFAGTGSIGLEAISRGITFAYFFENNEIINKNLSENCNKICNRDQFEINNENLLNNYNLNINYAVSFLFIDPPYKLNPFESILKKILENNILDNNSVIITESGKSNVIPVINSIKIIKEKNYGKTKITFLKKN